MGQTNQKRLTGRAASFARRQAMASGGKAALARGSYGTTTPGRSAPAPRAPAQASSPQPPAAPKATATPAAMRSMTAAGRQRAMDRRQRQTQGKQALVSRSTTTTPSAAAGKSSGLTGRDASLARRRAIGSRGKAELGNIERHAPARPQPSQAPPDDKGSCSCGCKHEDKGSAPKSTGSSAAPNRQQRPVKVNRSAASKGRMMSMARRSAMAGRGKAGLNSSSGGISTAQMMGNSGMSSREIAMQVRQDRCTNGRCGGTKPRPTGRPTAKRTREAGGAAVPPKVQTSETSRGQRVTGSKVGRSTKVTGDEPGSCRNVTGTEYIGTELFQQFCETAPAPTPMRTGISSTVSGQRVTGNEVGRSSRVTGDEPGSCRAITGTEYIAPEQYAAFCKTKPAEPVRKVGASPTGKGKTVTGSMVGRSSRVTGNEAGAGRTTTGTPYTHPAPGEAPPKVGQTQTVRGRAVTGTLVGRSTRVTGDEPGSCQRVTGNEYVGPEQYQTYCQIPAEPTAEKVATIETWHGQTVTGTPVGRSAKVTGDEHGACDIITGTPYLGPDQYRTYCGPEATQAAALRTRSLRGTPGPSMTGLQPGIGARLTGAGKGACKAITGTPYVGDDQYFEACGTSADATPGSADFPQPIGGGNWAAFSIQSPARAAQAARQQRGITGTRYDQDGGRITGPFAMGHGVITGTEDFRIKQGTAPVMMAAPAAAPAAGGADAARPRITGEGMDSGLKITGDDWGRNDRVTGTEGTSALSRNPTRRGGTAGPFAGVRAFMDSKARNVPESRITGSSGSTEKGALVTLSGGARG